jgi:hypothetical protein
VANLIYGNLYIEILGDKMPKKLTVLIRDDLDEQFRNAVFERKGMHKGNLTEALEEAIEQWIKTRKGDSSLGKRK